MCHSYRCVEVVWGRWPDEEEEEAACTWWRCGARQLTPRPVPVRNTDFGHLRDGLTRTLLARQKAARTRGELSPEDDEKLSVATQQLKGLFPSGSVPKGKQLLLVKSADGKLFAEYEGRVLGTVHNQWVADNMMLAYFANKDVISTAVSGFEQSM